MGEALQGLLDKQALHELVLKYCRACDRRDFVLLRSLYHDDAIDDHGAMFCGSADEYLAWLPGVLANFEATVHAITNALFEVRWDEAQGELYTIAYHRTRSPAAREITIGGRYLDRYARRAGVWKFAHRSLALALHELVQSTNAIHVVQRGEVRDDLARAHEVDAGKEHSIRVQQVLHGRGRFVQPLSPTAGEALVVACRRPGDATVPQGAQLLEGRRRDDDQRRK